MALSAQHRTGNPLCRVAKRIAVFFIVASLGTAAVTDGVALGSRQSVGTSSDLARPRRTRPQAVGLPNVLPPRVPPVQMPNVIPPEIEPVCLPQVAPAGANPPTLDTRPWSRARARAVTPVCEIG
jgi:hypothetical protein